MTKKDVAIPATNPEAKQDAEKQDVTETAPQENALEPDTQGASIQALARITAGHTPEMVESIKALLSAMDPNKPGFEEMGGARWRPAIIKIHQGMSGDTPGNSKIGDLYTDTGDVLPHPFELIPIYMHYSHAKFEEGNNNPACRSEDGKTSIYGDPCSECADLPFRKGTRTDCNKSIEVYALSKDISVYRVQFAKTSYRAGTKLYRQASSSSVPWARVYALDSEQKTPMSGTGKYGVLNINATGEVTNPLLFPLISEIYEVISTLRKGALAQIVSRANAGQEIVDQLPTAFSTPQSSGKKTTPDFTDIG